MTVVAKFYCGKKTVYENSPTAAEIRFGAVCRGRENRAWASATPGGQITLGILNDAATAYFEEGAEYLVTFTKVEPPALGDGHPPIPAPYHGSENDSICETCGVQALRVAATGELDWWVHDQLYGERAENIQMDEIQAYMDAKNAVWASAWASAR